LIAVGCGSGSSNKTTNTTAASTGGSGLANQRYADNNTPFSPVVGGTLSMLGTGDVDYMDPNVSYYSGGYAGLRMWSRQLYTYPATTG
jgi:peptide/nickel transport system substrate-binding protein